MKNNKKFKQLLDSIKWYKERKDKTNQSLLATDFEKDRKLIRERAESYKKEEENKELFVKDLSINTKDEAQKAKFEDFSKRLKKDAIIEESMFIISDMLKVTKS